MQIFVTNWELVFVRFYAPPFLHLETTRRENRGPDAAIRARATFTSIDVSASKRLSSARARVKRT